MIEMFVICDTGVSIDVKSRKICFNGIDCIKYRTVKQFDVAYEMLMKVVEHCKEYMYKIEEEMKKACKEESYD